MDDLYVSDHAEEWGLDWDGLKGMGPLAYVYNHDMPDCSEFGCIGIELSAAAGLPRIWLRVQIWQDIRRTMRMPDIASLAERAGRRIRQGQQGSPCDSPRG